MLIFQGVSGAIPLGFHVHFTYSNSLHSREFRFTPDMVPWICFQKTKLTGNKHVYTLRFEYPHKLTEDLVNHLNMVMGISTIP